jgi:hypothetical protein
MPHEEKNSDIRSDHSRFGDLRYQVLPASRRVAYRSNRIHSNLCSYCGNTADAPLMYAILASG